MSLMLTCMEELIVFNVFLLIIEPSKHFTSHVWVHPFTPPCRINHQDLEIITHAHSYAKKTAWGAILGFGALLRVSWSNDICTAGVTIEPRIEIFYVYNICLEEFYYCCNQKSRSENWHWLWVEQGVKAVYCGPGGGLGGKWMTCAHDEWGETQTLEVTQSWKHLQRF